MSSNVNKISSLVRGLVLIYLVIAHVTESRVVEWGRRATSTSSVPKEEEKKDTGKRTSIVLNWISVCQDLCSSNFAGARCGPNFECRSIENDVSMHRHSSLPQLSVDSVHLHDLCEILCENGLGGVRCNNCIKSHENRSVTSHKSPNFNKICTFVRCDMENLSLHGCSSCDYDKTSENRIVKASESSVTQAQKDGTSTPDWIGLCVVFCSQGQGGSACNCDKLPLRLSSNVNKELVQ